MRFSLRKSKELLDFIPKELKAKYRVFVVKRRAWWLKYLLIGIVLTPFLSVYYYTFQYTGDLVNDLGQPLDLTKPERTDFKKSSIVYGSNGEIIGRFFYENRDTVKSSDIPDLVKNGFIAVEDKRFNPNRPHKMPVRDQICDPLYVGMDPCAILRAAVGHYLFRSSNLSGASTIPQQYVRLIYGDEVKAFRDRDHNIWRKIKEARVAIQLSKRYSEDKIIGDFLNQIYLGRGVNGIAEASRRYFGKDMAQLTAQEIAMLASMNKSPNKYSPLFVDPDKNDKNYGKKLDKEKVRMSFARERYNSSLGRMLEDGYISKETYDASIFKTDEDLDKDLAELRPLKNPTFGYGNRIVKEFLLSQGKKEKEISNNGGLRIYTTIDPKLQKIASEAFEKHLKDINGIEGLKGADRIDGAFIILEVKTGNILALNGGHDFNETQYNRVFATRSPGSGFKPFVYAAALEQGMDYFDKVCNCPFTKRGANGKLWSPKNFPDKNPQPTGYIDLARGPIWSLNLLTLNLAQKVGMPAVIQTSNNLGIWGNPGIVRDSEGEIWFRRPGYDIRGGIESTLPTAIGASGVNLVELANAYTVFYRNGKYVHPTLIKEIRGTYGDLLYQTEKPEQKPVLSEESAAKMLAMMRAVTKIGTAKISMRNIEQQVACKTGTSNGPKDVSIWCGTPEIFIGIRLGHDDFSKNIEVPKYMKEVSGDSEMLATGGWLVGSLARKMFDLYYADRQKVPFPENVETDLQTLLDHYSGVR